MAQLKYWQADGKFYADKNLKGIQNHMPNKKAEKPKPQIGDIEAGGIGGKYAPGAVHWNDWWNDPLFKAAPIPAAPIAQPEPAFAVKLPPQPEAELEIPPPPKVEKYENAKYDLEKIIKALEADGEEVPEIMRNTLGRILYLEKNDNNYDNVWNDGWKVGWEDHAAQVKQGQN